MTSRIVTLLLLVGLAFSALALVPQLRAWRLPGDHSTYEPQQPIAYSHRLHAGELSIPCQYCHSGAETSRHAGIPAASVCMNCHAYITAPRSAVRAEEELAKKEKRKSRRVVSAELAKLYDAVGAGPDMKPDPNRATKAIQWVRIHHVPDFVAFDHRPHVAGGVACQTCHGPVETMERVRQVETLSMGWCLQCHRQSNGVVVNGRPLQGTTDCAACHI